MCSLKLRWPGIDLTTSVTPSFPHATTAKANHSCGSTTVLHLHLTSNWTQLQLTYAHTRGMAFLTTKNSTNIQQHCVQISCSKIHQNWTINLKNMDRHSLTALGKVQFLLRSLAGTHRLSMNCSRQHPYWTCSRLDENAENTGIISFAFICAAWLSLHWFSLNSQLLNSSCRQRSPALNFTEIRQETWTVQVQTHLHPHAKYHSQKAIFTKLVLSQQLILNFMKIWQKVQLLILGHRYEDRWTWSLY